MSKWKLSLFSSRRVTSDSIRRALCVGWLVVGLGLAGCPGGPEGPLREIEVGTGRSFTPIEEDATLELNSGGQGSQHVFVSLRAWELTNLKTEVKLSLERVSDGAQLSAPYKVNLRFSRPTQEGEPAKLEGLLLVVNDPAEAVGREVRINASFESDDGEHGTDSRSGTLQWAQNAFP
ncbi:hypothetical protein JY651_40250 [Pyxidicoccus parkwayensis]|uniref:Lipoprotein n=1 Tax=Pyxidicoccus parkwayensis TaxID=2813578 RepID=A0ABX7NR56_9BACT|nr:hypothetical protein [Pyxidicoccus parkwaysis]QSQ21357.1 hypothetical protein JY651_40250 [Pyxidicoccus parkwaysis]